MKTKSLLTAIAVVVLSTSVGYAQKVEKDLVDGHPVINCEDMPASVYTTTTKGNTEESLKTEAANKTVYKRFAVYKSDNNTAINWYGAFTVCSNISGGGWRLPTQRELILMWVLKRELERIGPFYLSSYWSATDYQMTTGWTVDFSTGRTDLYDKSIKSAVVRCVREL